MLMKRIAYATFSEFYMWAGTSADKEFHQMIDPTNKIAQLLLGHFLGVQHAIIPILVYERVGIDKPRVYAPTTLFTWLQDIHDNMDESMKHMIAWPLKVMTMFQELFTQRAIELPTIVAIRNAAKPRKLTE